MYHVKKCNTWNGRNAEISLSINNAFINIYNFNDIKVLVICACNRGVHAVQSSISKPMSWIEVHLFLPSLCGLDCRSADTISVTDSCEELIRHTMANTDWSLDDFFGCGRHKLKLKYFISLPYKGFTNTHASRHPGKIMSEKHNWTQTGAKTISNIEVTFLDGVPSFINHENHFCAK